MSVMEQLIKLLKSAVEAKVVTITDLATSAQCSRQHIYNVLQGKHVPSMVMAEHLAHAIGANFTLSFRKTSKKMSA